MTSILAKKSHNVNSSPFVPSSCQRGDVASVPGVVTSEQPSGSVFYGLKPSPLSPRSLNPLAICHTEPSKDLNNLSRDLRVYNNLLEVPDSNILVKSKRMNQNDSRGSRRGKILKRSIKSKLNQMKHIYKLPVLPEMFSLITWADDVAGYLNQSEKKELMNFHKKAFRNWLAKVLTGYEWFFVWTQQWKVRKTGKETKGQLTPHVHLLWRIKGMNENDYRRFVNRMNLKWIEITGTKDVGNALRVASDPKNDQYLGDSPKKAISYCVKYCMDQYSDQGDPNESIGRCWGSWGNIKPSAPEKITLSENNIVKLKRLLRRKAKKAKGWYLTSLKVMPMGTMAFIWGKEIIRYAEWLNYEEFTDWLVKENK